MMIPCNVNCSTYFPQIQSFLKNGFFFNALNLSFETVIIAGRLKCCGMEDQTVVAYGY